MLRTGYRADQVTVVQFPIQINVQRALSSVVHPGHVVPGMEVDRTGSVTCHEISARIGKFETNCARPPVNCCI